MSFSELAQGIGAGLGLSRPPIALAFVDEPPQGVNQTVGEVPSSCAFWRQAEERIFYASAERHFNCPVGAMVMGFELPSTIQAELLTLASMMGDCDYLTADEVARIPSMKKAKKGIVYGPLKDFPIAPDIILLWLTPTQSMIFSEAAGSSKWSEIVSPAPAGRPACAVIPFALERGQPTLSLGCMGMRTFTQITDGLLLAALPGDQAAEFPAIFLSQGGGGYHLVAAYQLGGWYLISLSDRSDRDLRYRHNLKPLFTITLTKSHSTNA